MEQERKDTPPERRKLMERRIAGADRRRPTPPVMGDRRTRFSVLYFIIAFVLLIGLNTLLSRGNTRQIPYSELKSRIQAGQIKHVVLGPSVIRATVVDSQQRRLGAAQLTSVRVPDDDKLIPLLDAKAVTYTGTAQSWFSQLLIWLLPMGIIFLAWFWMLRRINPAQGIMTIGKNRARLVGEAGTGVTFGDVAGADEAKQELM